MITNTVIVFLRDLLPIFILYCYLSIFFSRIIIKGHDFTNTRGVLSKKHWIQSAVSGLTLTVVLFLTAEPISDWFSGKGLEISHVVLICIAYLCFIAIPLINRRKVKNNFNLVFVLIIGTGAFISLKSTEFIFYFWVHKQQAGQVLNIIIGCVLGLGICVSFSILYRFFLSELLDSQYYRWFFLLWFGFLAGQLSQITSLLSQVDLLNVGTPIFDISSLVNDRSEYGHILSALLGYESSPSLQWLIVYAIGLLIPLTIHLIRKKLKPSRREKAAFHE